MDKGAHFYNCDFQVHSPRDINWHGDRPVTTEDRKQYAEEFITACRTKEIKAVAITDHHDFGFLPYIKEAAANEMDENNNPIAEENRIVVFPGLELTLGVPCQAILILDADFPIGFLSQILTTLGITPNDTNEDTHAPVIPIEHIADLNFLYETLDKQDWLVGRYIILPNVTESSSASIIRSRFAPKYKQMPCVGGYFDGLISAEGTGNREIIEGNDRNYGNKSLGLFQTSDNRHRDFNLLGTHTTWVKWSVPTSEAIRQACLAKESRISQTQPQLPSVYITSIDVSNSKFMGRINFEFNRQYNALIGGRGTGKSTILEYLRWALCDQPPSFDSNEELPDFQTKRKNLIEKTLFDFKSIIQAEFMINNVPHIIRRDVQTHEVKIKIGTDPFTECSEEELRSILPIQAYSQKQLSNVGVRESELIRFIKTPIRKRNEEITERLNTIKSSIKKVYENINRKRVLEKENDRDKLELKSLVKQIEDFRKELKGVSDDEQKTIKLQSSYEKEDDIIRTWLGEIEQTKENIDELTNSIKYFPTTLDSFEELPNSDLLSKMQDSINNGFKNIRDNITKIEELFTIQDDKILLKELIDNLTKWRKQRSAFAKLYESVKEKSTANEKQLQQIKEIEERIAELQEKSTKNKLAITKIEEPETKYESLLKEWYDLHKERADILEEQCKKLTDLSNGYLKATLSRGAITKDIENEFKGILTGTKIRSAKIESIFEKVRDSENSITEWNKILKELEVLTLYGQGGLPPQPELPKTPIISSLGFSQNDRERIAEKLSIEDWINLSTMSLDDLPVFQYKLREEQFINFSDASAGQQATSLLFALLNQDGPPLIIDQPEDDLDNQIVLEVVEQIWKAKEKRQIIFASHNANIVVNGDSELVICCDYKTSGDQSGGKIKSLGAIDDYKIKKEITLVMEGGEKAFQLRKEKYGF